MSNSAKTEIIKHLFVILEAGPENSIEASNKFITFLTKDAEFRLGNSDTIVGHKNICKSLVAFCQQVKSIYHDIKYVWEPEKNVVLLDMEVTYYRLDGTIVTLPVMDFFRFKGNLIQELRIFMDINPLFA
jgi:hypothetical protein